MKPNAAAYAESAEMDAAMWDDAGDVDPMTDDERAADEARATAAIHGNGMRCTRLQPSSAPPMRCRAGTSGRIANRLSRVPRPWHPGRVLIIRTKETMQ